MRAFESAKFERKMKARDKALPLQCVPEENCDSGIGFSFQLSSSSYDGAGQTNILKRPSAPINIHLDNQTNFWCQAYLFTLVLQFQPVQGINNQYDGVA